MRISPSAQYKTCRPLCQLRFLFWKISKHSSNLERTLGFISARSRCTRRVSARQLGRPATEYARHAAQNLRRAFMSLPTDCSACTPSSRVAACKTWMPPPLTLARLVTRRRSPCHLPLGLTAAPQTRHRPAQPLPAELVEPCSQRRHSRASIPRF